MRNVEGFNRKLGGLAAAGLGLAAVSAWEAASTLRRFPRIRMSGDRVSLLWMSTTYWAAWESLGPFRPVPRPFDMDFGNDVVSAELRGAAADVQVKKIGRMNIPMRYFRPSSKSLCAELNACRDRALEEASRH
jgi:hypothetical protein